MRRTFLIAFGTIAALATAAVAIAVTTAAGVSPAKATFAAGKVDESKTRTCTGADGKAWEVTHGHYSGTITFADPNAALGGPLVIHAKAAFDTTDSLGVIEGSFRSKDESDDSRLRGRFAGTLDSAGKMVGYLVGDARGRRTKVLGNLSATFNKTTGFADGQFGAGSSTAVLGVIAGPVCRDSKSEPKPKPEGRPVEVRGEVTVITGDGMNLPGTITVKGKGPGSATCTRDAASPQTKPADYPSGTKVEMKCVNLAGIWTLRQIEKH